VSGVAWIAFGALAAFVLLAVALSALERERNEKGPHQEEGDDG
jgi:hypothetical protein